MMMTLLLFLVVLKSSSSSFSLDFIGVSTRAQKERFRSKKMEGNSFVKGFRVLGVFRVLKVVRV